MSRACWLLAVAIGMLSVSGSAAVDRNAFTFTTYALDVRIEPTQHRLAVRGKVTLRNDSEQPQRVAVLQISSSLNWRSIRVAGSPVQFVSQTYTSDIDHTGALSEAVVTLPHEVAPRGSAEIEIGYEGVIVADATRLTRIGAPEDVARHSDWDQIGTSSTGLRGIGYVAWYPVAMEAQNLSDGGAMFRVLGQWRVRHANSTMSLSVTVDAGASGENSFTIVCDRGSAGASDTATCTFAPIGNAAPVLFAGHYEVSNAPHARVFHQLEHKTAADVYAKAADDAASLVTNWFGAPKRKAVIVELADTDAAPYEAANLLAVPLGKADAKAADELLAHQLTHAAFASRRPWIYEGVAHFVQALAIEQQAGRDAAQNYLGLHRASVLQAEKDGGQPLNDASDEAFYRSKAALVWWMLRDLAGEEALKQTLHAYQAEQDQNPEYFENLLRARSKRDLGWFFHDWVYTDAGLPDFRIESANTRKMTGESYVTAVTVENLGRAGAEVPVTVRCEQGDYTEKLEVRAKAKAVIRISTPAEPIDVQVNDGRVPETDVTNNTFKIKAP